MSRISANTVYLTVMYSRNVFTYFGAIYSEAKQLDDAVVHFLGGSALRIAGFECCGLGRVERIFAQLGYWVVCFVGIL